MKTSVTMGQAIINMPMILNSISASQMIKVMPWLPFVVPRNCKGLFAGQLNPGYGCVWYLGFQRFIIFNGWSCTTPDRLLCNLWVLLDSQLLIKEQVATMARRPLQNFVLCTSCTIFWIIGLSHWCSGHLSFGLLKYALHGAILEVFESYNWFRMLWCKLFWRHM